MSDMQHAMAQALQEKAWIEDRLNECRQRNKQGIPISIGDIETLLMMALDQGRALQRGFPCSTCQGQGGWPCPDAKLRWEG